MGLIYLGEEGSAPSTPGANSAVLYFKSDGLLYAKDDAGTETLVSLPVATQANQETGTSLVTAVTPGRQQYHPSAAKAWDLVTVSGGTPTLTVNFNMASVTDSGVGVITHNLTTAFSSANFPVTATRYGGASAEFAGVPSDGTTAAYRTVRTATGGGSVDGSVCTNAAGDQ